MTTDPQGNEIIGSFETILQIVGPGEDEDEDIPDNAHEDFEFVELPPLFINPSLVQVSFDLSPFAGDDIKIRFQFDSGDEIGNDGEGWYLDDIEVSGAGTQTVVVATHPPRPARERHCERHTSTTLFRAFSQSFVLSEGANVVLADAEQTYRACLRSSTKRFDLARSKRYTGSPESLVVVCRSAFRYCCACRRTILPQTGGGDF